jgi:glycosyltransferase involved in cell wall biosynthesis
MSVDGSQWAVVYRREDGIDAIDEYSRRLVAAIRDLQPEVDYFPDGLPELLDRRPTPSWVLLQYNPFRYGRWGFAPKLLSDVRRLRRADVQVALMVHEAWLDMTDWRTSVMGSWQRLQLRALVRQADAVMTSTQAIAKMLGHGAIHLPVATNITPVDVPSQIARERIGVDRALVVSLFGRDHPSRALEYAEAAIIALAQAHGAHSLTVLNLGADAPEVSVPAGVEVRDSGQQPPFELSLGLGASDLMLLPFTDGVSTRRSTLMAAFAHRRPVLGLCGKNTDQVLLDATDALTLTPVGDLDAFARTAVELTREPQLLRAKGEAGRRLYEERFDWPVAAARVTELLEDAARRPAVPTT